LSDFVDSPSFEHFQTMLGETRRTQTSACLYTGKHLVVWFEKLSHFLVICVFLLNNYERVRPAQGQEELASDDFSLILRQKWKEAVDYVQQRKEKACICFLFYLTLDSCFDFSGYFVWITNPEF
jgi:hypothetical protein